ncbi:hypothetical protein INR49_017840, partial [Caranx melampygus]
MSGRDPFPSPKLENCFTLSGFRPQQRKSYNKPTHISQTEEPWNRLYYTATLASIRRSVMQYEPQAPNDSLDLHLNSVHDQSKDFLRTKSQVLYQKESVYEDRSSERRFFSASSSLSRRIKAADSVCRAFIQVGLLSFDLGSLLLDASQLDIDGIDCRRHIWLVANFGKLCFQHGHLGLPQCSKLSPGIISLPPHTLKLLT